MPQLPAKSSSTRNRQSERLSIVVQISVYTGKDTNPHETTTIDISRSGLAFVSKYPFRPGTNLHIAFERSKDRPSHCRKIPARIVRNARDSKANRYLVGAVFTDNRIAGEEIAELLRAEMRTSQALLQVLNASSPTGKLNTLLNRISGAAARALGAEKVLLFLQGDSPGIFARNGASGSRSMKFHAQSGLLGYALSCGKLLNVLEPLKHPRFSAPSDRAIPPDCRSLHCVPFRYGEEGLSGLFVAINKRHGIFSREDERLAMAITNQISIFLRENLLVDRIRNLSRFNERILASIPTGIITFDSSAQLTSINQAAKQIFGLPHSVDSKLGLCDIFAGAANAPLYSIAEKVLRTRRRLVAYDMCFFRADHTSRSFNLTAEPIGSPEGRDAGGMLVVDDITKEQRLMSTLCRYLAREVAEQIVHDEQISKLGGIHAEVTVLIVDIRNFTSISEQLDPKELMLLLNTCFPRMINVIFRHHGMVDKFMGDAILSVFGVPVRSPDDPLRAVHAAIEMRNELSIINHDLLRQNKMPLEIGIGITSGTVLSGNIGSERRMDFTVIGDPVNLASRLEGMTKELDRKILINENVYKSIRERIDCESLGTFKIRGKSERVRVFSVRTER